MYKMPRLIDFNEKTAFKNVSKLFNLVYQVPIRTKKDLMNYLGAETIDQALHEGIRIYNDEVEKENALREKEARIRRNQKAKDKRDEKQFVNKLTTEEFDFTFKSIEQFVKYMDKIPDDKQWLLTINGFKYVLNYKTKQRLMDIILNNQEVLQQESDFELVKIFADDTTVHFKQLKEKKVGYSLNEGGFFAFTHDIDMDLTDFQISREIDAEILKDNCFIYALKISQIVPEKVPSICSQILGRDIPQRKLKEIAEKFDIYITVEKPQEAIKTKTKVVEYGVNTNPHLRLGLLEEHYFLIKEVPYTSYAIKNYELLKDKERWGEFFKNGARDKKRFINSYELILLMKECGYFKPMEMTNELMKTVYHDKVKTLTILEEVNDKNHKPNVYKAKKENDFINVVFDFETTTSGKKHKPYMVHIFNDEVDKTFHGLTCAKQMFYELSKLGKNIRLIAHNAGYDIRFIYEHLYNFTMINRSKFLLRGYGTFYFGNKKSMKVEIQDSYAIISSPLRDFGKMFELDVKKEIMPYEIYTEENVKKQYLTKELFKDIKDHDEFFKNCKEWKCIVNNKVDIIKYSQIYCRMDCIVLWKGYNKFKTWIDEVCGLNIDYYISSASIAHDYMLKEGVYDECNMLSGIPREFIQKSMVGGRTMMSENKQHHIKNNVDDFDAVSLYPSAMKRVGGYLKGLPKILTELNYEFLQKCDGYFVEIKIIEVNKHYKFPLMSKIGEVREFTNDMVNEILVVDKTTLEDLIQFQKIKFEIIKGYYYNEGRNNKIEEVITHLFNTRKLHKKNKNPIEQIFKLMMNSGYGKTLLKPFETESKYVKNIDEHASKYYKHIKEIIPLHNETYKVEHYKSICEHFNNCYVGVEVLSMSKRIMNEVMCLAEDTGLNMYYQDTDSIHIDSESVSILANAYKTKYERELIGNEMGQFHTDFSSKTLKGDLVSIESIYLGKKCYIDKLSDGTGIDYHVRMKGVPTQSIEYYANNNNLTMFEVYEKLYIGEKITFDLACGGEKCCFDYRADMTIKSLYKFERDIQFKKK